jgi:diguanylate cyclase (GGDEF)-like protein
MNYPNHLEELRANFVNQITEILENQSRTQRYATDNIQLTHDVCVDIVEKLKTGLTFTSHEEGKFAMRSAMDSCDRLNRSLSLLFEQYKHQQQRNRSRIQEVIVEFNHALKTLSSVLIEKDLLERQSKVLESIILSHEKVAQWKEFVQNILLDFHSIFPFNFFYITFAEEHGVSLFLYVLGDYAPETLKNARQKLSLQMIESIGLPKDSVIDIEEFNIPCKHSTFSGRELGMNMISVPVVDQSINLAGLLGVAYASNNKISVQEESVIRAILSVMVMVVGSSKALSKSLLELEYYAVHDPLTGLYNRRQFNDILEYEVGRCERHKHEFCVLMIDLDNFKDINDSYGHPTGDAALCKIAEVLRKNSRKGDLCARIGGDEFAIILVETAAHSGQLVAEAMSKMLRETTFISTQGDRFHLTMSIGLSSYPQDAKTADDLMAGVDVAMYRAKSLGKDSVCLVESIEERINVRETLNQVEELRNALQENRIVPYYQSIVDCQTGEVMAFETLARLKTLDGETRSAAMFIETIEKYGLSRDLDRAIITNAFEAKRELIKANAPEATAKIFINLSVQEIQGRGILGFAEELCQKMEIPPELIVFELLERDAIGDMTNMRRFLNNLRSKGFSFALDDFGSGYNSFHYLRDLHFEYVKIDGAFVRNIMASKLDYALVHNLSRLCQDIGMLTIAEFVENEEILLALQDMGINYVQGYHISMPLPEMLITERRRA